MGCLNGFSKTCGNSNSAGISRIKLVDLDEVASVTETSDVISAVGLDMGAVWYAYDFEEDTASFSEVKVDGKKAIWNLTLQLSWARMDNSQRAELMAMVDCNCGIMAAVEDNNGIIWIVGGAPSSAGVISAQGLYLTGNEANTGASLEADENQQTVVLTGRQRFKAKTFSGAWSDLAVS